MGCISSKQAVSVTPVLDCSGALRKQHSTVLSSSFRKHSACSNAAKERAEWGLSNAELEELMRGSFHGSPSVGVRLHNLRKYIEAEQVAAGWPAWLSAAAGEAIQGWVPLKSDNFQKLEKIGQGTYSNVFRACNLVDGRIVALKKVRFDNFDPDSVRFMAREIQILRRLNHPNVVKLEGLIASNFSYNIYLVFEYMEHDLVGLTSCPNIKFTESQVKCYMHQLLSGLQHCHSLGIMHRDIKGSNLLVNNEGILKMADFGLANFCKAGYRRPLTSRVVTLWYRPPELLLGSTDYGLSVDLWSVGCVFAELLLGRPILQGRTEVEQLHKIFKLCGSPPDEYWRNSRLPHAIVFKPQQPYECCLHQICKSFPSSTLNLIETLLSVEPFKRGTASSALKSEYFKTRPFACDPSSLPKYPPNKEIDATSREEARRKKILERVRGSEVSKKPTGEPCSNNVRGAHMTADGKPNEPSEGCEFRHYVVPQQEAINLPSEAVHPKHTCLGKISFSGPLPTSNDVSLVKKQRESNPTSKSHSRFSSGGSSGDSSTIPQQKLVENTEACVNSDGHDIEEVKGKKMKQWVQFECPGPFHGSDMLLSDDSSETFQQRNVLPTKANLCIRMGYQGNAERVEFSGPLPCEVNKIDEMLQRNERHIRQVVRRSQPQRGRLKSP